MFLIHRDTPVRIQDVETGTGAERLASFKQQVGLDRVVHFFRSEDDLRAGLLQALNSVLSAVQAEEQPSTVESASSDLSISSLASARRVQPLAGHPTRTRPSDSRPVVTG